MRKTAYAGPCAFDPRLAALLCLQDGLQYAIRFMQQTGLTVSPFLAGYQPVPGELDEEWKDKKQGKFFNQVKIV